MGFEKSTGMVGSATWYNRLIKLDTFRIAANDIGNNNLFAPPPGKKVGRPIRTSRFLRSSRKHEEKLELFLGRNLIDLVGPDQGQSSIDHVRKLTVWHVPQQEEYHNQVHKVYRVGEHNDICQT